MPPRWPEPDKPPPKHIRTRRCRDGTCWTCTPHTALRDLLAGGRGPTWRQRLLIMLVEAGYTTPDQIEAAPDADLLKIRNFGEGCVTYVRDALAGHHPPGDGPPRPVPEADRLAALIEAAMTRQRGGRALP